MRVAISRKNLLKLALIGVFVGSALAVCLLSEQETKASASGPSPSFTGAPGEDNCTACHVDFPVNSGTGGVQIGGIPRFYLPGQQIAITVTTNQEDGVNYGFQLTSVDDFGRPAGTWKLQDTIQTQIVAGFVGPNLRQYVEHTFAGIVPTTFGSKSWTVFWTAPTRRSGKVSFHAAGNAANGNGSTGGDYIYTAVENSLNATTAPEDDDDSTRKIP